MEKVSILIAAYQAEGTLGRTLDSVRQAQYEGQVEVIAADDGSTDQTAALARARGAKVIALDHQGRAAALNAGLKAATGDIIFFTDADCIVPPDWITETLLQLGDYDGVGGNLWPSRFTAVELAKVLRYVEEFELDFELAGEYAGRCLNGNNMALRRKALEAVAGFDASFMHGADADLTRRLLQAGYRLRRTTATRTVHLKVDSLCQFLQTAWRRGSTVRFGMKSGSESPTSLARALFLSPWKWLLRDYARLPHLLVLGAGANTWRIWFAPLINFLHGIVNACGRIYYYRRFRREGS